MKTIILACLGMATTLTLPAQVDGPYNGNQFSNAVISGYTQVWTNTGNVQSSDNAYANFGDLDPGVGSHTDYLVVTDFGFNLPAGVTIFGVKVEVERSDPNGLTSDYSIRIVRGGLIGTQEKSTGISYPITDAYQAYGGATDLWGENLSYKDIDNSNFGVAIAAQRNTAGGVTAGAIDDIIVTVYYGTLTTLPVQLISFDAVKENNSVRITWHSASENALDGYSLERSGDGRLFYPLATIAPANQPNASYTIIDEHPLAGTSYYRLRIKDAGSADRFSKIAIINFNKYATIQLSPSPCTRGSELFIPNPGRQLLTIQFFNSEGKIIGKTNTSNQQVSMPNLPAMNGMIYYRVTSVNNKLIGSGSLIVL